MQAEIKIEDQDQSRDYHLLVDFRCVEETHGGYCCDINRVFIESVTVWLAKCGMEVCIDPVHRREWTREVERVYQDDIIEACIEHFEGIKHQSREVA
jgi:hypothetical protein